MQQANPDYQENSTVPEDELDSESKLMGIARAIESISAQDSEFAAMPPEAQRELVSVMQSQHFVSQFQGPLPPPNLLREYESIAPGCGEKIINNMLDESSHRRKMDDKSLSNAITYTKRGQNMAFFIALLGIATGMGIFALAALWGIPSQGLIAGTILSGSSLVALVAKFIDGAKTKERSAPDDTSPEGD